jgi:hypothetical protein
MILTPIPRERLGTVLDGFGAALSEPVARAAFDLIRATSPDRAAGAAAERDRLAALAVACRHGIPAHPDGTACIFNWDGRALDAGTEAYVILHEIAHYLLAPLWRRALPDFGLGPGPDTIDRAGAERAATGSLLEREAEEAAASLLGILWEAELGQPALASFLDQNWLEGLRRSAATHFTAVVRKLVADRLWNIA